jgi:hypothetical protein
MLQFTSSENASSPLYAYSYGKISFKSGEVFRNASFTQNATAQYSQGHVIQNSGLDIITHCYLKEVTRLSPTPHTSLSI